MTRAEAFRTAVDDDYTLDTEHQPLLDSVCATLDAIEALEASVARDGVTVTGSRGQVRTHPALPELRQQHLALARLLSTLFPEDESAGTRQARRAAKARWSR